MTKDSILKLAGAFHGLKTSRMRFCACSYSAGEHCGRSFHVIMYFIILLLFRICWGYGPLLTGRAQQLTTGNRGARIPRLNGLRQAKTWLFVAEGFCGADAGGGG